MIPFSSYEIGISLLGAIVFGLSFAVLYELILVVFYAVSILLSANREVYIYKKGNTVKKISNTIKESVNATQNRKWISIYQFFFTFAFGLCYTAIQFILCDGSFRVYFALAVVVTFFYSRRLFNKYIVDIFYCVIHYILALFIVFVSLIISPTYFLLHKLFHKKKSCDNA